MESRTPIYIVLAVVLGYLLISAVPERFTGPEEEAVREDAEKLYGMETDAPQIEGSASDLSSTRGALNIVSDYGIWLVDLIVALGVYFIAKRRLT